MYPTEEIKSKIKRIRRNNIYKRLFIRNREHLGLKSIYNLYWVRPIGRLLSKGIFISDDDLNFPDWLNQIKDKSYTKALILGNAFSLNELSDGKFQEFKSAGYLSIGINRSIYKFQTDILAWSDLRTIDDILKKRAIKSNDTNVLHIKLERDHRIPAKNDERFQNLHRFWDANHNLRAWNRTKLFMFRNTLIGVLHLCYCLQIKEILMVGFEFDDRNYFYTEAEKTISRKYEVKSKDKIEERFGGYDTQKIVKEFLEYLILKEDFSISYTGPSEFLKTVIRLEHISL